MGDSIDIFLEKIGLAKYRKNFDKEGVKIISDFRRFIGKIDVLKKNIGMTSVEIKRFFRLCGPTIQEIEYNNSVRLLCKVKSGSKIEPNCLIPLPREAPRESIAHYIPKLYCKLLNKEGIICNTSYPIEVVSSMKYYEFVRKVYQKIILTKVIKGVNFTSVELYSETGYPLAPTPNVYLKALSNWGLRDNELIYAYPKKLFKEYKFVSGVDCDEFVIRIQLKDSDIRKELKFNKKHIFYSDLKILLSQEMHIPTDYIDIYHLNQAKQCEEIAPDNLSISKRYFEKINLSFTISDTYNNDEPFSAFHSVYTSCYPSIIRSDFNTFNAYLLFLVREYGENRDKDRLLRRLGLLRKISCSPPLVYSLYLLFTQSPTSLPHRIAINEGIITTISLLSTTSDRPTISKFPQMWMHIEEHALTPDLQLTEIYETTFISKRTRENPRDDDTRRLLQAFPPNQDTIVTWRNASSTHDSFSYTPPTRLEDFTEGVKHRFPLQHPVQLYKSFVEERKSYGLMLPLIRGLSTPCVFLGRTEGRYGYFNYFSPEDGRCYSYNPHDIDISERLDISDIKTYKKIVLILDVSEDMNHMFLGNIKTNNGPELTQLEVALLLIETLVDSLIGFQCQYLLGAIVISQEHGFKNSVNFDPTFDYCALLKNIQKAKEKISQNKSKKTRVPDGIILNSLMHYFNNYSSHDNVSNTQIFLFTNNVASGKYDGPNKKPSGSTYTPIHVVNNIILSNQVADELKAISQKTKGIHMNYNTVSSLMSIESKVVSNFQPILQYSSTLQDVLSGAGIGNYFRDYKRLIDHFASKLICTEELIDLSEKKLDKIPHKCIVSLSTTSKSILSKVTAYIKSPNPYCRLYSYKNTLNWIVSMQGPIHSPFQSSIFLLKLYFGEYYPHYPPKLRFLSSVYHPNVDKAGLICHPILIEDYSPSVSLRQILDAIHSMLAQPIISHAVRSMVLEMVVWHHKSYNQLVDDFCIQLCLKGKTLFTLEQDLKIKSDYSKVSHPPVLVCPITNQLFDNPVMTPEGNTYERHAILQHIENTHIDPISHTPLRSSDLIPNHAIADAVLKYKKKSNAETN